MEFLAQALRQVVFMLDSVAYGLIPAAYELIFYLSNVNLATNDLFIALVNRIYLLLGIFMLFKVSFSIMQYIVDPNAFSDKSKGFGKLVTNALVAVVLLAMVPFIFEKAYELQSKIILSNVIPNLILGERLGDYSNLQGSDLKGKQKKFKKQQEEIESMAKDVQFAMFSGFYSLNTNEEGGYPSCDPSEDGNGPTSNIIGSSDLIKSPCWENEVKTALTDELHKQGGQLKGLYKYCDEPDCSGEDDPHDDRNFATFAYLLWWMKDGGDKGFTISYFPIVSAAVGLYLLLLLITFAIDIAARVFKLLFLQAVAPIAIVSYIDPKESASNGKLHNWIMESLKTYFSLFLRLAVIYLAIQLCKLITSVIYAPLSDNGTSVYFYNGMAPEGTMNMFVFIFLILGVFIFAKKVPQMIEGIFGLKISGEMHLNPIKAINENALASGIVGAGAGLIGGTMAGAKGFATTGKARSLFAGAASGMQFGIKNRGKDGVLGNSRNNAYKDITGNDYARLNFATAVMGTGARKRIDQIDNLNDINKNYIAGKTQTLDELQYLKKKTRDKMYDISDKDKEYAKTLPERKQKADQKLAELQTARANGQFVSDSDFEKARVSAEHYTNEIKNNEYLNLQSEYNQLISEIDKVQGEIKSAEKDMETLKGQKKEEQRIGRIDPTPSISVEKAMNNSRNRQ